MLLVGPQDLAHEDSWRHGGRAGSMDGDPVLPKFDRVREEERRGHHPGRLRARLRPQGHPVRPHGRQRRVAVSRPMVARLLRARARRLGGFRGRREQREDANDDAGVHRAVRGFRARRGGIRGAGSRGKTRRHGPVPANVELRGRRSRAERRIPARFALLSRLFPDAQADVEAAVHLAVPRAAGRRHAAARGRLAHRRLAHHDPRIQKVCHVPSGAPAAHTRRGHRDVRRPPRPGLDRVPALPRRHADRVHAGGRGDGLHSSKVAALRGVARSRSQSDGQLRVRR